MRDSETFTVDDPRFSDRPGCRAVDALAGRRGHRRHRDPFSQAFRGPAATPGLRARCRRGRPAGRRAAAGRAELRRGLACPLAVAVVAELLGLAETDPAVILSWYDAIVGAVTALSADSGRGTGTAAPPAAAPPAAASAGAQSAAAAPSPRPPPARPGRRPSASCGPASGRRSTRRAAPARAAQARPAAGGISSLIAAAAGTGGLTEDEVASNAAVLMFGGIETTEGMICNAILHLLSHPGPLGEAAADQDLLAARGAGVAAAGAGRGGDRSLRHRRRGRRRRPAPARRPGHRLHRGREP